MASLLMMNNVQAQTTNWKKDEKLSVMFGLTQPMFAKGFNFELNYINKRLIVDFSHGMYLDYGSNLVTSELKKQQVVVHLPFSTGLGIGYRFTHWLNGRLEPKWHHFQFYYAGESKNTTTMITSDKYNISLGIGVYTFFQPFKHKENLLKGITLAPSVRYWPTIHSSFDGNGYNYQNKFTGKVETITTPASGIALSPLIVNVSIGYTFDLKPKHGL